MPVGDVTATFGIDDSRWIAGVARMQNANKQLGNSMRQDVGRSVSQVGFAVQDFASVFSMGGERALSRAMLSTMNNVQMLGAAFGGWGLAITSVAGAIGSILLPKLLEANEETEELSKNWKKVISEMRESSGDFGKAVRFERGLGRMEFREEATRKRETLEDELLEARSEHERFARDVRFKVREEMGAGRLRLPTGFHEEFMNLRDVLRKLEPVTKTEDWLLATAQFPAKGSAESMVAMKKLLEELEKSGKPIGELERRLGLTRQRESELPEREKRKRTGSADFDAVELGSVENWRQLVAAMRGQKIDEDKAKEETLKKVSDAVSAALPKFDAMITELKKGETPTVPIGAGG